jgi:uracil-DNA glycosylase
MERAPNPDFPAVRIPPRVLVAGQAPGNLADTTGTPFNDPSGDRLRDWMGVSRDEFYDASPDRHPADGASAFPAMMPRVETCRP